MCNPGSRMGSTDLRRDEAPPSSAAGKPGALQVIWGKLPVAGLCCLTPVLLFAPFFFFFTLGHSGPSHQLCSKHLQTLLQTQKVRGTVPSWSHKLPHLLTPSTGPAHPSFFRVASGGIPQAPTRIPWGIFVPRLGLLRIDTPTAGLILTFPDSRPLPSEKFSNTALQMSMNWKHLVRIWEASPWTSRHVSPRQPF